MWELYCDGLQLYGVIQTCTNQLRQKEVPQNDTIRVNIYSCLFGQDERQAYTVFSEVPKDKTSLSVDMGKIKQIRTAIQRTKSLMTDLGLMKIDLI